MGEYECIEPSLELEDNVFDNDTFYTPPSNMTKAIFIEIENHMNINYGRRHSCIMLDYHLKIVDQVLYLGPSWHAPLRCTLKYVEKNFKKIIMQEDILPYALLSTQVFTFMKM